MSDDDVLDDLARLARERRRVDPRWDALALGELSPEEREQLMEQEDAAALQSLFEPLGDAFADAATAKILAQIPASRPAPNQEVRGEVVRPMFGRARWVAILVPVLAMAALALFFVVPRDSGVALPDYAVEVRGGDQQVRGDPVTTGTIRLSSGSRIEIVGRPAVRVDGPVDAAAIVKSAGETRPWTGGIEVSDSGSVRLHGTLGRDVVLPVGPGEIEITIHARGDEKAVRMLKVPIVVE